MWRISMTYEKVKLRYTRYDIKLYCYKIMRIRK